MTTVLQFDEEATRRLVAAYLTPDVIEQRRRTMEVASPRPGEDALDVGSGPGFLACDLAAAVASEGRVTGVDISDPVLVFSRGEAQRLGITNVEFVAGDAQDLPVPDRSVDVVVAIQVLEYVADVDQALREIRRVLRPGGRVLIMDTDWDSVVWHSPDRDLTRRVLSAWDEHLVDPHLPPTLSIRLARAGFELRSTETVPLLNTRYTPDTYGYGLAHFIASFAPGRGGLTAEDVRRWLAGFEHVDADGAYFFGISRYSFLATPA